MRKNTVQKEAWFSPFICIFCKSSDRPFVSQEHIIPESLGNKDHILPPGVVCDSCNNYFSRKVEGPILNSEYFRRIRSRNGIPNKRNRIPVQEFFMVGQKFKMEAGVLRDGSKYLCPSDPRHNDKFASLYSSKSTFSLIQPAELAEPENKLFSRFLLKMGLEALAEKMLPVKGGVKIDHIENGDLDEARNFCRRGVGKFSWPFHQIRIYEEGYPRILGHVDHDILHEYTLFFVGGEVYFVIAILGLQYAINLGGPELDGFEYWLLSSDHSSPLYPDEELITNVGTWNHDFRSS